MSDREYRISPAIIPGLFTFGDGEVDMAPLAEIAVEDLHTIAEDWKAALLNKAVYARTRKALADAEATKPNHCKRCHHRWDGERGLHCPDCDSWLTG